MTGETTGHLLEEFHASRGEEWVVLKWRAHESLTHWRILRSESGFAESVDDAAKPDSDQTLVYEGSAPEFEESGLIGGVDYYYTVFGLNPDGEWVGQAEVRIKPKAKHEWVRHEAVDADESQYVQAMGRLRIGGILAP